MVNLIMLKKKAKAYFHLTDCSCNTVGTIENSVECTANDGECNCDEDAGYHGTKCDQCLEGWWCD